MLKGLLMMAGDIIMMIGYGERVSYHDSGLLRAVLTFSVIFWLLSMIFTCSGLYADSVLCIALDIVIPAAIIGWIIYARKTARQEIIEEAEKQKYAKHTQQPK